MYLERKKSFVICLIIKQLKMNEQAQIFGFWNTHSPPLLLIFLPSHNFLDFEETEDENLQFFMEAPFH